MKGRVVIASFLFLGSSLLAQSRSSSAQRSAKHNNGVAVVPAVGQVKIDAAKEADIRRLMELIGTKSLVIQLMEEMERNIKPLMTSSLPAGEYRAQLVDLFFVKFHSKANPQQVLDLAVPAYDRYYSHEEIKGLSRFYETPLGQKTVSALPALMGELQAAGRTWGEGLGRDSMMEVLSEHPELGQALNAAKNAPSQ
jgi:uncharacterized protein